MAWVTPTNVATGDVLTAATWNQDVVANAAAVAPFFGAWTTFTPQLRTGTTNRTSTVNYARYVQVGKLVIVQVSVAATAAGGASETIKVGLPSGLTVVNSSPDNIIGSFLIKDTGTAYYVGGANIVEAGYVSGISYGGVNQMGANAPAFTMASGDVLSYAVIVEVS
jgi:hypothetical protein